LAGGQDPQDFFLRTYMNPVMPKFETGACELSTAP
jgi:hypothetical protein